MRAFYPSNVAAVAPFLRHDCERPFPARRRRL